MYKFFGISFKVRGLDFSPLEFELDYGLALSNIQVKSLSMWLLWKDTVSFLLHLRSVRMGGSQWPCSIGA